MLWKARLPPLEEDGTQIAKLLVIPDQIHHGKSSEEFNGPKVPAASKHVLYDVQRIKIRFERPRYGHVFSN